MKYQLISPFHPLQIPVGLLVWCLWFMAFYGGLSVACSVSPPNPANGPFTWLNGCLGLFTLATFTFLARMAWKAWSLARTSEELDERQLVVTRLAGYVYTVAALATLLMGVPLIQLPPCV
ncbi:hypothetical protein [Azomonas macrocytogenes]|uniref:Uncharacterized protein n=1 Tax=Azomonas macrocytogenes TaxID=69962 RepID=A0A839T1E7_AZOMA|nr:hypothetical protein [Azomonas macrocytogenes]MBB3102336.1 hypothetical protein [Azomonas macrocytogenes]